MTTSLSTTYATNGKTPLEIWKKRNYSSISSSEDNNSSRSIHLSSSSTQKEKREGFLFGFQQHCFGRNDDTLLSSSSSLGSRCFYRHCSRKNRILGILLIALILSIVSCYFIQKAAIYRKDHQINMKGMGSLTDAIPPKTAPTLLSIVDPNTNYYIYAPENELYAKIYYNGTFYDDYYSMTITNNATKGNDAEMLPQLKLDKSQIHIYESIKLSWTTTTTTSTTTTNLKTTKEQQPQHEIIIDDLDIIALYCNSDDSTGLKKQSPYNFLEAATIQQIKATSRKHSSIGSSDGIHNNIKSNEWYIPKFPNLRKEYCHFRLYSVEYEDDDDNENINLIHIATSDTIQILEAKSTPTQIHLAVGDNPTKMIIQFTTGDIPNTIPVAEVAAVSDSSSKSITTTTTATADDFINSNGTTTSLYYYGDTDTYGPENLCGSPANETMAGKFYPPGMLHAIEIDNLQPDTTYTYQVGLVQSNNDIDYNEDGQQQQQQHQILKWSDGYSFTTPPIEGGDREVSFIVYGDQGCPYMGWQIGQEWLSTMMSREAEEVAAEKNDNNNNHNHYARPAMIRHFGDLSYSMGSAHVWDGWMEMLQPFAPTIPLMVAIGNHEYDHTSGGEDGTDLSGVTTSHGYMPDWGNFENDSNGECGVPTSKRFHMPTSPGSNSVFWYSFGYASIYTIVLSSEHDLSPSSIQYKFLEDTLKDIDRITFPWVIVEIHRPMYEAEAGLHAEKGNTIVAEAIRLRLEDFLLNYKVDVVLAGHYHEYHRTCDGVYKGKCNSGGPIHITIGSAGATLDTDIELDTPWSLKHIGGKFGYGRITIPNATDLHFEFILHGDSNDPRGGQVEDDFWIHRDR